MRGQRGELRTINCCLTASGRDLLENFLPLQRFAERWSKRLED
jgi:hypothetical protein